MSYFAHPWRCTIAVALLASASMSARAANCSYTTETPVPLTSVSQLGGAITVGRDVPIGTEIYKATFNTTAPARLSCPAGSYTATRQYATSPGAPSAYTHPTLGPIYRTSVSGIGYAVWYAGSGLPTNNSQTYNITTTFIGNTAFDVSFFKIGDVAAGTIQGSDLAQVELVMTGDSSLRAYLGRFIGTLNVVAKTCTTPDVTVDLGEHLVSELSGPGTATKWVDVPVRLQNCPAFHGAFRRDLTNDSGFATTHTTANQIQYRVDATTTVIDASRSIMALKDADADTSAKGVGIQVAQTANESVGFGTTRASGLTLTATDGGNYTIPLRARYVQTGPSVSGGMADGQATVTFVYQ
jgi:type 1 fimbria pilin